jgi:hypothetical protein
LERALKGLEERLPLMPAFRNKARSLAKAIAQVDGLRVTSDPPQTSAFQVILSGRPRGWTQSATRSQGTWGLLLYELAPHNPIYGLVTFEVHIRTAGLLLRDSEVAEAISMFRSLIR